ncbi:MAG: site-specific integrase, partial [Spirochaetaceae bacterium]|nr:site-specific integrase [Spirochaetaceae bacterium]
MARLPFSVFRRKGRKFFYVQFKGEDGGYLPAVSTRQTSEAAAIETAFKWYREGKPSSKGGSVKVSLRNTLRDIQTAAEADFICEDLKRRGLLKSYVVAESKQAVDFGSFLQNFWDYDASPYIKEKLRKNHGIHRNYTTGQRLAVQRYWIPFFEGRLLGDITRQDIENLMDSLAGRKLSSGRKNTILRAGTIPLRWAFSKEIIEKDITFKITWFSGKAAERQILSPEIVQALFRVEWRDERSRLASMLAAVTGLRAGEIRGLRVQDLGRDCLYIRHSWNHLDGLKTTKNNEIRTVEVPFPSLANELLDLAGRNPHGADMDSYVFWARLSPSKPMKNGVLVDGLRDALVKTGMSAESADGYVFHGWRHFFTAYMRGRLNEKLLQSQTGHKTAAMLDHYSGHQIDGDRDKIRRAQLDVFGP